MTYFEDLKCLYSEELLQNFYLELGSLSKERYEFLKSLRGFDHFSCWEYEEGNYDYRWLSFDNKAGEYKVYLLDEEWKEKTIVTFDDLFEEVEDAC